MGNVITLVNQCIIMFILAFVGYLMFRAKKISLEGSKSLGNILIYLSLPCVIVNGFLVERSTERMVGLGVSLFFSILLIGGSILISRLALGKNAIDNFGGSFSNPGFFGIPLITAMLSSAAVFYVAPFVACLNFGQWTYGASVLANSDENGLIQKREKAPVDISRTIIGVLKVPSMIAIIIGVTLFLTGIQLPVIATKCVTFIAGLNTPIAMFTIGIYMAQIDVLGMFAKKHLYYVSFVRMVLCAVFGIALLSLIPSSFYELKLALLIAAACPIGSNVAVYAQLHNRDYGYAVETVIISTLLSIITIPSVVVIAQRIWG